MNKKAVNWTIAWIIVVIAALSLFGLFFFSEWITLGEINETGIDELQENESIFLEDPFLDSEFCLLNESFTCQEQCTPEYGETEVYPEEEFVDCEQHCCIVEDIIDPDYGIHFDEETIESFYDPYSMDAFEDQPACSQEEGTSTCSMSENCEGEILSLIGGDICCKGKCVMKTQEEIDELIKETWVR